MRHLCTIFIFSLAALSLTRPCFAATTPCVNQQQIVRDTASVEPNVVTTRGTNVYLLFTIYAHPRPPGPWSGSINLAIDGRKMLAVDEYVAGSKPIRLSLFGLRPGPHIIDIGMPTGVGPFTSFHTCIVVPGHARITYWEPA